MEKVVTSTGFECEIDPDVKDDYDFFEAVVKLDKGDMQQLPVLVGMLFSDEEDYNRLKDHCRDEKGRSRTSRIVAELTNIFTELGGGIGKKS